MLKCILFICGLNEVLSIVFIVNGIPKGLLFTINVTIHHALWLALLTQTMQNFKYQIGIMAVFIGLAVMNVVCYEGFYDFNFNTFIAGAFLYLILFIYECFKQLKAENFDFFTDDVFVLLFSPVLFFVGFSFIFGFRSIDLSNTFISENITLHSLIAGAVNISYYALLNLYIFKQRRKYVA